MKKLWRKIKAHFSGWPESVSEENKIKEEKVKLKPKIKPKKVKGLNPKKKKTRKQGNLK